MKRTLLLALLVGLVGFAGPSFALADAPQKTAEKIAKVVPFELLKTQHMVVDVKLNGEGPFRLIFDTGAPVTLINNKVARAAGLVDKKSKPIMPLFPGMAQFKVKSFEIGELSAPNVPVLVMDHPTVTAISNVLGPIDGIVGFSLFARYKMTIDYQAKQMTFTPVKFEPPDVMSRMMAMMTVGKPAAAKVLAPAGQWGFRVAKAPDDKDSGVSVREVLPGSPAAQAGLKIGDRLLTLDGRWTDTVTDCYVAASHVRPGTAARLQVKRDGKEMELTVKVQAGF